METIESFVDVGNGPRDIITVVGVSSKGGLFQVGRIAINGGVVYRGGGNEFDGILGEFVINRSFHQVLYYYSFPFL